jgi:hypothetical protein
LLIKARLACQKDRMSDLVDWAAPERNKGPILEVLRRVLPGAGTVLELASATGQHIAHFAAELPELVWQPSDVSEEHLRNLRARREHVALPNLLPPVQLDVTRLPWAVGSVDAIYNANMIHIAPFAATMGLFEGAGAALRPGSPLVLYGPFAFDGKHVSESNIAFDESLKARNPQWGVRDVRDLEKVASRHGLALEERVAMPANNFTLIWRKR